MICYYLLVALRPLLLYEVRARLDFRIVGWTHRAHEVASGWAKNQRLLMN